MAAMRETELQAELTASDSPRDKTRLIELPRLICGSDQADIIASDAAESLWNNESTAFTPWLVWLSEPVPIGEVTDIEAQHIDFILCQR